jgi:formylglycine-generating enzyme required for sulfatase activity
MGSPENEPCRHADEDQHLVTLTNDFEIQATEVTQGQFTALMGYNPAHFGPDGPGASCGTDCPVENVNWHEAVAYCNALSQQAGRAQCYTCTGSQKTVTCEEAVAYSGQAIYACPGYRLPTEAEWEYAYRAGTTEAYYSGPNDAGGCTSCSAVDVNADKIGWYCANAASTTHPVGQKQPNPWGLYDMGGNGWEWCHDRHRKSLGVDAVTDPWGTANGPSRVVRGGSFFFHARYMRAAFRITGTPSFSSYHYTFRCARTS